MRSWNWIAVEVNREVKDGKLSFHIYCRQCGHDTYSSSHPGAMIRAQCMAAHHIPYSPDGHANCYDWGGGAWV